jgi:TolB-like protein/Tfp pilus assembly protein PilF
VRLQRSLLRLTWVELRRRKVVRAGIAYALVAWVVLQLAEITYGPLGLPDWALTWTVLGAVLGLPVVLVFAWFVDVSRSGMRREQGAAGAAGPAFAVAVVLLTVAGLAWWLTDVYRPADLQAARGPAAVPAAPANAIAVLPFDDLSPEGDQQFLADGIAEELLDRLASSPRLRVAARTSSFALGRAAGEGGRADVASIARRLNVRWIVEGSVRKQGGRIRVTAQLIDAADGFHVWSETYEQPDTDLFALQDAVTGAIARELTARVGELGIAAEGDAGTGNAEALQAYLQGREAWRLRTPAALERAEVAFQRAVALDPDFARAWSGLSDTYLLQADYGSRPLAQAIALAEPASVRAVTLGPQLGEAWASVGLLRLTVGQLDAARRSLEQAMQLDPRYEMAPLWLATAYARQGEYALQRSTLEQALALNPLEPVININYASALLRVDPVRAREQLLKVLAVTPDDPTLLRGLADVERRLGDLAAALAAARAALDADPGAPASIALLARLLLVIEDFARADALIAMLPEGGLRTLLAQERRLRSGDTALEPALQAWLAALPEQAQAEPDRIALLLAGTALLRAGQAAEAALLLERAAGTPDELGGDPNRLDAAGLLIEALQAAGRAADARAWRDALLPALRSWLERAGNGAETRYARALLAIAEDQREAALEQLEAAVAEGFSERWLLRFDPRLGTLREDPRVQALQQQLAERFARLRA